MDNENVFAENAGAARQNDITPTVIHSQPKKQGTTLRPAEWLQKLSRCRANTFSTYRMELHPLK